ncbi:hypothetical protein [uncultured Vagococcus sp.]|uniref:hypothetical protein n=1 Tax=uncultured Vagococcus sp. TaxID=189676 RepID=UPI0028D669D0|nr:hypothetical protein [uncultured Vagococcus sp.]
MMVIWEGTDVVCCYNVATQKELKRIRLVHLPKNPEPNKVVEFAKLFLEVLPTKYSKDSVQILTRTRYF